LRVVCDCRAHSAAGGREGHFNFDFRAAVFFLDEITVVDKAEVDDIYRDFRVVTLSQLVPNRFFVDWPVVLCRRRLLAIRT
jgi:hypothetical protein